MDVDKLQRFVAIESKCHRHSNISKFFLVRGRSIPRSSAAKGVALHQACVGCRLQYPVVACNRRNASLGPIPRHFDVVAALAKSIDGGRREPAFDGQMSRLREARVKGTWEMGCVERRRVDGRLQMQPEVDMAQEEGQRPLVLPVTTGSPERHVRLAVFQRDCGRQCRPRAFAGCQ